MALVFGAITALAPGAQAAGVVAAGTIQAVSGPGIALHAPPDGRLNGDGFTLAVSGYRFAYMVGSGVSARYAAPDQVLLVFGFTGTGSSAEATLMVDGQGQALPDASTSGSATPLYFLTSVPVGAKDVALAVSADGFSQTFSFTKGRREGPHPTVLYASKGHWEQVDSIASTTNIPTPDRVNDLDAGVTVQITSATLTYFLPGTAATPPSPSKAWLVLFGAALPYNAAPGGPNDDSNEDYQKTLPPSDFTLTLPGAKPMAAMLTGQGGPDDESGNSGGWGLFGGDYYWDVPAGARAATLDIHLPAELAAQPGYYGDHWGSVTEVPVEGKIPSTQVAFAPVPYQAPPSGATNPPPWAPNPGGGSVPSPGHQKTASGKLVARASSGGGTLFVLVGAIVVLLAVLGAIAFRGFGRRRVLPALARATASPAERAAADVAAFLPSPGITEPKTDRARPGPAEALATEPAIVAILPKPAPSPAQPALVPVPEEPAPLPEGAIEVQMIGPVGLAGDVPAGAHDLGDSLLETLAFLAQTPAGPSVARRCKRRWGQAGTTNGHRARSAPT